MKVRIKILGILGGRQKDNPLTRDMDIEIQDGACVQDLLVHLNIPEGSHAVVTMNGKILKLEDKLSNGAALTLFQAVFGG